MIRSAQTVLAFVQGMVNHLLAKVVFNGDELHFLLCSCDAFDGWDADDQWDTVAV